MKHLIFAALAISTVAIGVVPAEARGGCGHGYHRGPHGRCIPNWRHPRW